MPKQLSDIFQNCGGPESSLMEISASFDFLAFTFLTPPSLSELRGQRGAGGKTQKEQQSNRKGNMRFLNKV